MDCVIDIMDYAAVHDSYASTLRVLLVGDFNDLSKHFEMITNVTGLISIVTFPTREEDKLLTSFLLTSSLSITHLKNSLLLVNQTIVLCYGARL